jgi:hypothetical protein
MLYRRLKKQSDSPNFLHRRKRVVLLRDHPLMSRKGVPNWPPVWTWMRGKKDKYPKGEVGILKAVLPPKIMPADGLPTYFLSGIRISRLPAIRRPRFLQAHNRRSSVLPQSSDCRDW